MTYQKDGETKLHFHSSLLKSDFLSFNIDFYITSHNNSVKLLPVSIDRQLLRDIEQPKATC